MSKPYWNGGYSGQSLDELLALEESYAPDSLLFPIELAIEQKQERTGEENLSPEEIVVLAVEALEREVNNGGYSQFFINSSRVYTPVILTSLSRIGCTKTAEITERALQAAGFTELRGEALGEALDAYGQEWFERNKTRIINYTKTARAAEKDASNIAAPESSADWEAREKKLDECDQRFYQCPDPIGEKLFQFIKANKAAIRF
jgi:hypothetical protein